MHAPPALPAAIARACGPRRRPRGRARGRGALLGALLLALLPAAPASSDLLPDALRIQIERALAEKAARTPVERKLDSGLLHAIRVRRGRVPVPGLPDLRSGAPPTGDGLHPVRIRGAWTTRLRERLARMGRPAERRGLRRRYTATRLGLEEIAALAALDEVTGIVPASRPFHRKLDTSEGDVAHRVAALRSQLGVDGTGLRVAVLSDGVDSLAARQASGDLPAGVQVLPGQAGSGDEGTAMLEIVHDLAPGAELFFATGFAGQSLFAQNILALRAAGADVLVDDVGYFAEGVFQDDDVAAAVDTVTATSSSWKTPSAK